MLYDYLCMNQHNKSSVDISYTLQLLLDTPEYNPTRQLSHEFNLCRDNELQF